LSQVRLNLGCGSDVRPGYENVDLYASGLNIKTVDITRIPWPWDDESVDEILMLDIFEHIEYSKAPSILCECARVLKTGGFVDIQVPDFDHCASVMLCIDGMCNVCGQHLREDSDSISDILLLGLSCPTCGTTGRKIREAAMHRLYGGQDRPGNYHYAAYTEDMLHDMLYDAGLGLTHILEKEHQYANWNFKMRAYKAKPREQSWDDVL